MEQKHLLISFNDWLKTETGKIYKWVSIVFSVFYSSIPIAKLFGLDISKAINITSINPNQDWFAINFLIHTIFILYVVLIVAYKYVSFEKPNKSLDKEKSIWTNLRLYRSGEEAPKTDKESEDKWIEFKIAANKVIRQFVSFWFFCWMGWLVLYCLLTANAFCDSASPKLFSNSIIDLSNNTSSLMFVFLFLTLTISTSKYGMFYWIRFFIILLGIFILESVLSQSYPKSTFWFSLLSGLFASFSMAAFFGSINSKFISIPLWAVLLLNVYAAIQPLYVFFGTEGSSDVHAEILQTTVVVLAFLLKVLLFLLVTWILQTGRMSFFMVEESSLNFKQKTSFETFLSNIVLKENKLIEKNPADE